MCIYTSDDVFFTKFTVSNQLPQLTLSECAQPRIWHTVTALSLGPGQTHVTMFGGCPKWERGKIDDAQQKLAKTTVLEFGEQNTYAVLTFFGILLVVWFQFPF